MVDNCVIFGLPVKQLPELFRLEQSLMTTGNAKYSNVLTICTPVKCSIATSNLRIQIFGIGSIKNNSVAVDDIRRLGF